MNMKGSFIKRNFKHPQLRPLSLRLFVVLLLSVPTNNAWAGGDSSFSTSETTPVSADGTLRLPGLPGMEKHQDLQYIPRLLELDGSPTQLQQSEALESDSELVRRLTVGEEFGSPLFRNLILEQRTDSSSFLRWGIRKDQMPSVSRTFPKNELQKIPTPSFDNKQKFLSAAQAELFRRISNDPDSYVYFAEPAQSRTAGSLSSGFGFKQWSDAEKEKLKSNFSDILHRAPGLLLSAAANNKIALYRVSSLRHGINDVVVLKCSTGLILVPDEFLETAKHSHFLIHELLHLADSANHLSYSKDWIEFANPIIVQIREKENSASPKNLPLLAASTRKNGIWPNLEDCRNLSEAFASYFAEYVEGTDFPCDSVQIKRFSPHFLLPKPEELLFTEHFVSGQLAFKAKNFELAGSEFNEARKLDSSVARVYLALAGTSHGMHQYKKALRYCEKACNAFAAAGVPGTEDSFAWALAWRDWYRKVCTGRGQTLKPPAAKDYFKYNE